MKKLNANQIKYLLAALMVLDHLPHVPGLVPPLWEAIFHAVTRCVAAGFAYLAVEASSIPAICVAIKSASGVLLPSWRPVTGYLTASWLIVVSISAIISS